MTDDVHDAVVVGGGVAGLAAATWLGRHRRDTLVVDSGDYRTYSVEHSHGYLGRDPQSPAELLATAREQVARYATVSRIEGRVDDARGECGDFTLTLAGGAVVRALRVVLATGVRDLLPQIEGIDEHYGASAFHCPACDGYDVAGQDVVAYGWDARLAGFAGSLYDWARSVCVVTDGHEFEGDDDCRGFLGRHRIPLIEEKVAGLVGRRGHLRGVRLADGRELPAGVLFFSIGHEPRVDLARRLGCALDGDGYVEIDPSGHTSVEGVYAAGDVAPGLQLVQVAAAQGTVAGVAVALSLRGEPGSPLSPPPAPDAETEIATAPQG